MGRAQELTLCAKCNVSWGKGVPCKCVAKVSAPDHAPFVRDMLANMHRAGGDPLQRPGNRLSLNDKGAGENTMLDDTEALAKYCLLTRQYLDAVCGLNVPRVEKLVPKGYAPDALRDELDELQRQLREMAWPKPKVVVELSKHSDPKTSAPLVGGTGYDRHVESSTAKRVAEDAVKHGVMGDPLDRELNRPSRPSQIDIVSRLLKTGNHRFAHVRLVRAVTSTMAMSGTGNAYVVDKNGGISAELEHGVRYALFAGPTGRPLTLQWFGKHPMHQQALELIRREANTYRRDERPVCLVEDMS